MGRLKKPAAIRKPRRKPKEKSQHGEEGVDFVAGITVAEFAEKDGCAASYVYKAIERGLLPKLPNGKLDPALVGSDWRVGNVKKEKKKKANISEEIPGVDEEQGDMKLVEAQRIKEIYIALARKREHDLETGRVVLIETVVKKVASDYAEIRSKLLGLGATHAVKLSRLKTPGETQAYVNKMITDALEALMRPFEIPQ